MKLTAKGRQVLKARAHKLKPVILLGSKGLTKSVDVEIDRALKDHELIKIKVASDDRDERRETVNTICETHEAALVQLIGHVAVIYRKNDEK